MMTLYHHIMRFLFAFFVTATLVAGQPASLVAAQVGDACDVSCPCDDEADSDDDAPSDAPHAATEARDGDEDAAHDDACAPDCPDCDCDAVAMVAILSPLAASLPGMPMVSLVVGPHPILIDHTLFDIFIPPRTARA